MCSGKFHARNRWRGVLLRRFGVTAVSAAVVLVGLVLRLYLTVCVNLATIVCVWLSLACVVQPDRVEKGQVPELRSSDTLFTAYNALFLYTTVCILFPTLLDSVGLDRVEMLVFGGVLATLALLMPLFRLVMAVLRIKGMDLQAFIAKCILGGVMAVAWAYVAASASRADPLPWHSHRALLVPDGNDVYLASLALPVNCLAPTFGYVPREARSDFHVTNRGEVFLRPDRSPRYPVAVSVQCATLLHLQSDELVVSYLNVSDVDVIEVIANNHREPSRAVELGWMGIVCVFLLSMLIWIFVYVQLKER